MADLSNAVNTVIDSSSFAARCLAKVFLKFLLVMHRILYYRKDTEGLRIDPDHYIID